MSKGWEAVTGAVVGMLLMLMALETLAEPMVEVGVYTSFYEPTEVRTDSPVGFVVRGGLKEFPVYLWGSFDDNESGFLGQPFSKNEVMAFGFGARKTWGDFWGVVELGYASIDSSTHLKIQQEVVYTQIVQNHNVYQRPVPVDLTGPYDQESYTTEYELDDDFVAKVGVGYDLSEHWSVTATYRFLRPETYYNIIDTDWQERTGSDGYWEEHTTTNLDAFEIGVLWKY